MRCQLTSGREWSFVCGRCWKTLAGVQRENFKIAFNKNVERGTHGHDAQFFCDMPDCWNPVEKNKAAQGETKRYEHVDADRSRSPVLRPAERSRGSSSPARRMFTAIANLRSGLEMMQKAVDAISEAAARRYP